MLLLLFSLLVVLKIKQTVSNTKKTNNDMLNLFVCAFLLSKVQGGFVPDNYEEISQDPLGGFGAYEKCGEGKQLGLYKCVVYYKCNPDTNTIIEDEEQINTNGFGLIDIRFGENACEHHLDVCCKVPQGGLKPPTPIPTPKPTPSPQPPPPPTGNYCGIRNENGLDFKITGNTHGEAEYGEFPWMVALLKSNNNIYSSNSRVSFCGGSLIAPKVVLTGAHCVNKLAPQDIIVRAGEWDTQTTKERLSYQERQVTQIILHEQFQDSILYNDVALLVLNKSFKKAEHIATICLPEAGENIISQNCFATGWGKNVFGEEGQYSNILKKIELPIVPHQQCQNELRKTRLGKQFILHNSFICAGGQKGKDTCTGDGGSPLVCPDPHHPQRYVQTGVVAWGIGCLTETPGVYADVSKFRSWVDNQMQALGLSNQPYTV